MKKKGCYTLVQTCGLPCSCVFGQLICHAEENASFRKKKCKTVMEHR